MVANLGLRRVTQWGTYKRYSDAQVRRESQESECKVGVTHTWRLGVSLFILRSVVPPRDCVSVVQLSYKRTIFLSPACWSCPRMDDRKCKDAAVICDDVPEL